MTSMPEWSIVLVGLAAGCTAAAVAASAIIFDNDREGDGTRCRRLYCVHLHYTPLGVNLTLFTPNMVSV